MAKCFFIDAKKTGCGYFMFIFAASIVQLFLIEIKKMKKGRVKYSTLREVFRSGKKNIKVNDGLAALTHYLQCMGNGSSEYFSESAEEYMEVEGFNDEPIFQFKLPIEYDVPFPPPNNVTFKFIDLFAGIGGFRLALQDVGGKCVFSSEIDKQAKITYDANFGEFPFGDIRGFTGNDISDEQLDQLIPDHDLLAGGFPCQPFSLAGVSARNSLGLSHGFKDKNKGNLFLDIVRIAKIKRPKVLFLENVKNFKNHDNGKTFSFVKDIIENELGYSFNWTIIDSSPLVPQKRKRFYMVCLKNEEEFEFPNIEGEPQKLKDILEKNVSEKFTISDRLWEGHKNRTKRNLERGVGFTAFEANLEKPSNTLVSRYYKDGKECLIPQKGKNPRKLTPRECARLQGFPENFIIPVSNAAAYRQFGNSVAVPVIRKIAWKIIMKNKWRGEFDKIPPILETVS